MTQDVITSSAYRRVVLWAVALALFYLFAGCFGTRQLRGYKAQTEQIRQAWLEDTATKDNGKTGAGNMPNEATPNAVRVGMYINQITDIAVRESSWTADFDLWFQWKDKGLTPGETFQISNGEIEARDKRETIANGADHYERYRVRAQLTKHFDPTRFPFADEPLVIHVEDSVHGVNALNFVADAKNSGVSPTASVNDMIKINRFVTGVRLHDVGSERGRPGSSPERSNMRSQFVFAMLVNPPGTLFHLKLFHVLYSSVAIALLALFIKPIHVDPRFGLGVGAVFAAIGNMIAVATLLPRAQQATLADMINVIGLVTIFLTLVQSTISLYLFDSLGLEKLSRFFDKVSFAVLLAGYAAVNIVLPLVARN